MTGSEGRLGGDLSPGMNPFIFLLRYSTAKAAAENKHEQKSHGIMWGSDIVDYIQASLQQLCKKENYLCEQASGRFYVNPSMPAP